MQARSATFDAVVSASAPDRRRRSTSSSTVCPWPGYINLKVVSGTVTPFDRTAAQRGRCVTLTALSEPLLLPTATVALPYGAEVFVRRGIVHRDGTTEMMALGVYPVQQSTRDGVTLVTQLSGIDRSQLVADARLEDDYAIAQGTNVATAIHDLIDAGVPGLEYAFTPTNYTTPALVFSAQAGSSWDMRPGTWPPRSARSCSSTATACAVLRPEPMFFGTPVWTLSEGEGGLLVTAALSMDRSPAYNRVIATGENTGVGTVPRGVWTDTDPASPTNYFGPFGRKPRFYSSTFITTPDQAVSAATSIGSALKGVARSLDMTAVPNPALEPGDPVLIKRTALDINEVHLIDALTFSLGADGAMAASSRWGTTAS